MPASMTATFRSRARADDLAEVPLHLVWRQPPEAVVAAERDDEDPDVALQRPVEPAQSARGGVAGHARVHDLEPVAASVETALQE